MWCTFFALFLFACRAFASIYATNLDIVRGRLVGDQPISVLQHQEEDASWSQYLEMSSRFKGNFHFQTPPPPAGAVWTTIAVVIRAKGAEAGYQLWQWKIMDFSQGVFVVIGDNRNVPTWAWHTQHFASPVANRMTGSGVVTVQYTTDSKKDVSNLDYVAIELTTESLLNDVVIPLQASVTGVQPMSGIALWADSYNQDPIKLREGYVQLEFSYMRPSDVVIGRGEYNWGPVDRLLAEVSGRRKQAILRWYYVYPGEETAVPSYLKDLPGYTETVATTEGLETWFPDWGSSDLESATLEFYSAFGARYDSDPRVAFLQVGFGLWGEYHIYEPHTVLGINFPTKQFQKHFAEHLDHVLPTLLWSVSIDAGDTERSALPAMSESTFGLFDDSFLHKKHHKYNEDMWKIFKYAIRYKKSPHGGEISYYSKKDQRQALNPRGLYGRTYEELCAKFHITYMIGNDQPRYQSDNRIRKAGMANGYRFTIRQFLLLPARSEAMLIVENTGVAPMYYDAFLAIDESLSPDSLKGLLPGKTQKTHVHWNRSNVAPILTIKSSRLVPGQKIEYEAYLGI